MFDSIRFDRARAAAFISLLLAGSALSSEPVRAYEATQAEADRIRATYELYFGKPEAGRPGFVDVRPAGDSYDLTFDFSSFIDKLNATGAFKIGFDKMQTKIVPQPDGSWKQTIDAFPKFTFEANGSHMEGGYEGVASESVFDLGTMMLKSSSIKAKRLFVKSEQAATDNGPGASAEVSYDDLDSNFTGQPSAIAEAVDIAGTQKVAKVSETVKVEGGPGQPEVTIGLAAYDYTSNVRLTGLRHVALLDLWRWYVAQSATGKPVAEADPAGLKTRIAKLDAVFEELSGTTSVRDVGLESPFAIGGIKTITSAISTSGLTRAGRASFDMDISGFSAHSILLPGWSSKLMPTDLGIHVKGDGWNLADPFATWLQLVEFPNPRALTPEEQAKVFAQMLPKGTASVDFGGTRIAGALWNVTVDGRVDAGSAGAKGEIVVRAQGFGAVSGRLAEIRNDKTANELRGAIEMATMMAAKDGDALVWRFGFDGENVTLNGNPFGAAPKPAPTQQVAPPPAEKPGKAQKGGKAPKSGKVPATEDDEDGGKKSLEKERSGEDGKSSTGKKLQKGI